MIRPRLGIVVTHPIHNQVPLYRYLAARTSVEPVVLFLSEYGLTESFDPGFGRRLKFDIPLTGGYEHEVVRNRSIKPDIRTRWGMVNPGLPEAVKRSRLDVILVHGYSSLSHWLAYTTAACCSIPYMLRGESHPDGKSASRSKRVARRALIRPLVRHADACLAIGTLNRDFYLSCGAQPRRIFHVPYSVDTERFSRAGELGRARRTLMLESLGLAPEVPLVLFAAKLQPWKAPLDLVMAMDIMDRPANLVVIGDGPLRADAERLAAGRPWMRVLGFVNQMAIGEWYGAADLFVLPSHSEPWGLVVNEAMAAGAVPIVSDAVGSGPDLVADIGWIYPAGDIPALARTIAQACEPEALSKRRAPARQQSAGYGIAESAHGIETAVRTVLGYDVANQYPS
jgi:glycosyltransferase involved in cell wall biosynthesis